MMVFFTGYRLGKYELLRKVAATRLSEVWVAKNTSSGRTVALKTVRRIHENDAVVEAAEFGAELQKQIRDTRIATVHEYGTIGEFLYIDMEYIEGPDVGRILDARKSLPPDTAVKVAAEVCRTLVALDGFRATINGRKIHSAVHGDLKPGNVCIIGDISNGFSVRLLDFGTAKGLSMASPMGTRTPAFTPEYASPELLQRREMNQLSDRWALGVMLYEMVTGRLPFGDGAPGEVEKAILNATEPPPLNDVPPALRHILGRLLDPAISNRYRTAQELLGDLEKYPRMPAATSYRGPTKKAEDTDARGYRGHTVRTGENGSRSVPREPAARPPTTPRTPWPWTSWTSWTRLLPGLFAGRRRIALLALPALLLFSLGLRQCHAGRDAAQLERDLRAGAIDLETALGQYQQLQGRDLTLLPPGHQIPQLISAGFVARGDAILFRFQYEGVKIAEFTSALSFYQKAQQVLPADDPLKGRMVLGDAHVRRIQLGQTEEAIRVEEIARKYEEAAVLLPTSPDPLLGKAMLYLYCARSPEPGEEALNRAAAERNYPFTASVRWVQLLAETYAERARILEREAERLAQTLPDLAAQRLTTALRHHERAIHWYSQFPLHGSALARIELSRKAIERLNERREELLPESSESNEP